MGWAWPTRVYPQDVVAPTPKQAGLESQRYGPVVTQQLEVLLGEASTAPERRAAATALLVMADPEAERGLVWALETVDRPSVWEAVAQAVVGTGLDAELGNAVGEALLARLPMAVEARTQARLAEAMWWFDSPAMQAGLIELATDNAQTAGTREAAIAGLAGFGTQDAVGVLVGLTEPGQAEGVRGAAFEALAQSTGRADLGRDRDAWLAWWSSARAWSETQWQARRSDWLARRVRAQTAEQQRVAARLIEAMQGLYRQTATEQRVALLESWLVDALPTVRLLAMDLARQRINDGLPTEDTLRLALRENLEAGDPRLRERSARVLGDLADEQAAQRVALRLAGRLETDPTVLAAYLRLLTRVPQRDAVVPGLALLSQSRLRADAAGMLTAAFDAGLMEPAVARQMAALVRQLLPEGAVPSPQEVQLLARVGEEADWARIEAWLGSESAGVRLAAARVWVNAQRPLDAMIPHLEDATIQPIVYAAVQRRGESAAMLAALVEARPGDQVTNGALLETWRSAVVAMAGRIAVDDAYASILAYVQGEPDALGRLLVLNEACGLFAERLPGSEAERMLTLMRAEAELAAGRDEAALEAVALLESGVAGDAALRRDMVKIAAWLDLMEHQPAVELAEVLLSPAGESGLSTTRQAELVELFSDAALAMVEAEQVDEAAGMLEQLKRALGQRSLDPALAGLLQRAEQRIQDERQTTVVEDGPEGEQGGGAEGAGGAGADGGARSLNHTGGDWELGLSR